MRVTAIERHLLDDYIEISAQVQSLPKHAPDFRLWFRFPSWLADHLTADGDAFLAALLPVAVRRQAPLEIAGTVSDRLMTGCEQIMKIWRNWNPADRPVPVVPDATTAHEHSAGGIGQFFTLGVDSFYTLLKNLKTETGDGRISHLITVHGFDVGLENHDLFSQVAEGLDATANELGLRSVVVTTNLRQLTDRYCGWMRHQLGGALACVGLSLKQLFRRIYIASANTYADVLPCGVHPLTDPLWSTESLQFCHDGGEASRVQKILWQISRSEVALRFLRVCWRNPDNSYNCCRCEKCLRTMLNLHVAGVLHRCKTFEPTFDVSRFDTVIAPDEIYLRENLDALQKSGRDPELQQHLRRILARCPKLWPALRGLIRDIDRRCPGSVVHRLQRTFGP